jgi:hypothetical protein
MIVELQIKSRNRCSGRRIGLTRVALFNGVDSEAHYNASALNTHEDYKLRQQVI